MAGASAPAFTVGPQAQTEAGIEVRATASGKGSRHRQGQGLGLGLGRGIGLWIGDSGRGLCQDAAVPGKYDVVIVVWNHAGVLPACLAAVDRLEPAPARVVVVDNASSDGSAEMAAGAGVSGLEVRRLPENLGFAAALNRGLAASMAPWVLSLNPDCAPRPDFVARLLAAAEGAPGCGSATGKLLRAASDELSATSVVDAAGMVVTPSGRHLDRGAGADDDGRFDLPVAVFGGTGAATLYRRSALADVAYPGGEVLAESFFAYREDAELAWRLRWRGWSCRYVPGAVAVHRRGFRPEAGRAGHDEVNRHSVRNRFLLRVHCADLGWHMGCFPWWLLRDLLVVAACLTVERGSRPALTEAWRLRADALARRRWVLGRRTEPPRRVRRWFRTGGWVEESSTP